LTWFSPDIYRRALGLVWPASVSFTATFCLIEWQFRNPYTIQDILIRIVAAITVPLWGARLTRECPNRADGLPGLLVFAASTAGLGLLILFVYDTALLYNLAHLAVRLPVGVVALALLAVRYVVHPATDRPPGRCIDSVAHCFGWFLVTFFVPALPIRYGLGFSATYAAVGGVLVLLLVSMSYGLGEVFARRPERPLVWLLQLTAACVTGIAGMAATLPLPADHTETRLLWAVTAFLISVITVCALIDRLSPSAST
jgi:hypothetical protein